MSDVVVAAGRPAAALTESRGPSRASLCLWNTLVTKLAAAPAAVDRLRADRLCLFANVVPVRSVG